MFSLSSVRSVRTRIAPRLIKRVLARAFTDDHLLQEQYYGSKLEHLYLGRSIQAIWSAMKVATVLSCKHDFWHAKITRIIPRLSLHMKEASSYPNPLLDQLTDAEISSGHDTDFAPKAFAFQLFVGEEILPVLFCLLSCLNQRSNQFDYRRDLLWRIPVMIALIDPPAKRTK